MYSLLMSYLNNELYFIKDYSLLHYLYKKLTSKLA